MSISAIVYVSNTGFTAAYAEMLGKKTGLPVYSLEVAAKELPSGAPILYLGWLMASRIKDYPKAAKRYQIKAVCGVCLGTTGSQLDSVRSANRLPANLPLFTLQGGMDHDKLKGVYRSMIRTLIKVLSLKKNPSADESAMLSLMIQGGNFVSEEHLTDVLAWYEQNR